MLTGYARYSVIFAAALACSQPSRANPIEEFYKGKTLVVATGTGPVGTYAIYAQLIAEHLPRHLPGAPKIIVQSMPGAGGLRAVNHLYNVAPKDGTYMLVVVQTVATDQILQRDGARYDARRFNYIGRFADNTPITVVWKTTGRDSIDALRKMETMTAGTGAASPTDIWPKLLNVTAGMKFRIISGYKSIDDAALAMQRGETHAMIASLAFFRSGFAPLIRDGKASIVIQYAVSRHPDIADVPTASELATNAEDRAISDFMASSSDMGRSLIAPPDVPASRVEALQKAFDATMNDPEFRNEVTRRNLELNPASGQALQALVAKTLSVSPEVAERARKLIATD
jgi:tripartite-type tricarboxylate transporter receptor subunit TctC